MVCLLILVISSDFINCFRFQTYKKHRDVELGELLLFITGLQQVGVVFKNHYPFPVKYLCVIVNGVSESLLITAFFLCCGIFKTLI